MLTEPEKAAQPAVGLGILRERSVSSERRGMQPGRQVSRPAAHSGPPPNVPWHQKAKKEPLVSSCYKGLYAGGTQPGSNRRPQHCERCALPAELWALSCRVFLAGHTREAKSLASCGTPAERSEDYTDAYPIPQTVVFNPWRSGSMASMSLNFTLSSASVSVCFGASSSSSRSKGLSDSLGLRSGF